MPQGISEYVEVALPLGVHGTFTYSVPPELRADVRLGSRVEVPWGTKISTAFVTAFPTSPEIEKRRIRDIRSVLDDEEPALLPEILELCRWASEYYLAPLGETIRIALPANMSSRSRRAVRLAADAAALAAAFEDGRLLEADRPLVEALRSGEATVDALTRRFESARSAVRRLRDARLASVDDVFRDAAGVRYDRHFILDEPDAALTPKQKAIVELLRKRNGELPYKALAANQASDAALAALVRKGVVHVERRPRAHTLDSFFADLESVSVGDLVPSDQQVHAITTIRAKLGTFAPFLLEGVTGSGKTEIYIELMREVVRRGEQAILLVPEISLTPVFAARLKERFGDRIAILHSNLSAGERYDQWWRARRGTVDVAIGPRSALFTPFQRLGLIVVDEEGDSAYKQEEVPRYNARDLAVVRARLRGIPIVLGSATPSLESRENAESGKYTLIHLRQRVEARPLPEVEIVDVRKERGEKEDRGLLMFSGRLREEIRRVHAAGEQTIILINRRGYAPFLLCRQCENDFRCRDCSVTLTVHRRVGLLICHYCGKRKPIPPQCPLCGGEVLQPIGYGTEKVQERFFALFPDIPAEVLDRDTTRKKGELVRILDRFRRGETRVLIGTQIISKGHHFPAVTLTAVLNADSILGYPDFRSAEKTFYLLTQVAGRSGRGELPGRVLIQTAFPGHYAIQHAAQHDYEAFYAAEIEFRRRFRYPPASSMISIVFRGEDEAKVARAAEAAGSALEREASGIQDLRVQGPAAAPLARIKGVFRYQILLRSAQRARLRRAVSAATQTRGAPGVEVVVDVDPINIL